MYKSEPKPKWREGDVCSVVLRKVPEKSLVVCRAGEGRDDGVRVSGTSAEGDDSFSMINDQ